MKFKPCTGNCTEDGTHCEGCGSSHEEIRAMRQPIEKLVAFAGNMNYDNPAEFADAVAASIKYHLGLGH